MIDAIAQLALSVSKSVELLVLAKVTVVLAAGLLAAALSARWRASRRHLVLAATLAAALALPLMMATVPSAPIVVAGASSGGRDIVSSNLQSPAVPEASPVSA